MKRYRLFFLFLLFSFTACKTKDKVVKPENDIDAARDFIQAALEGDFDKARTYMLSDSANVNWMDVAERSYMKNDEETKYSYRKASIHIHDISNPVKDSVTIVIFSNSFKNDHDTLKVLKKDGQWLVDFKYLFEHDKDTLPLMPVLKDSL
ncbi:MAG: DUF4878 domain-containing protein [Chitinophagaceae bacterium]|nr:DUF4878 domain-containing protein [Chitinophagaceae bacterium]